MQDFGMPNSLISADKHTTDQMHHQPDDDPLMQMSGEAHVNQGFGKNDEDHGTFTVETKGETATIENGPMTRSAIGGETIENVPAIVGTDDYISEI